ncbi:hypothetical protein J6590_062670 [Homalodisca vitripennis]|nr:hypothetical protein J6590_062670 [Homalodisca vitripennis]
MQIMRMMFPRWFFPLYNLIGLLPLKIVIPGRMKISWPASMRSVAILSVIYGHMASILLTNLMSMTVTDDLKHLIMWMNQLSLQIGSAAIFLVTVVHCWLGHFTKIIANLVTTEKYFIRNKVHRKKSGEYVNKVALGMVLYMILFLIPFQTYYIWKEYDLLYYWHMMPFYVFSIIYVLFEMMLARIVMSLAQGFQRLNVIVELTTYEFTDGLPCHVVEEIRQTHHLLCQTVQEVNSFSEIQLLFVFGRLFINIVIDPYFILNACLKHTVIKNMGLYVVSLLGYILTSVCQLFLLVWVSHLTTHHAERSAFYVSRMLSFNLTCSCRKEVKQTLVQMSSSKMCLSVLSLFNIGLPLLVVVCIRVDVIQI